MGLKVIALCSMFIDHLGAVLVTALFYYSLEKPFPLAPESLRVFYRVCRDLGRLAFPIYLFLLTEGFFHSRSRARYLGRLALFALLSEIPFDLAFSWDVPSVRRFPFLEFSDQNVFFTLSLALAGMMLCERALACENIVLRYFLAACALAACPVLASLLHSDYGAWGTAAGEGVWLVTKLSRELRARSPQREPLPQGIVSMLRYTAGVLPLTALSGTEAFALLALPAIYLYSGQPGNRQGKLLFYLFYPAHLLLLWGLSLVFS